MLLLSPTMITDAQNRPSTFEVVSIKSWNVTPSNPRQTRQILTGVYPYGIVVSPNDRFTGTAVTLRQLIAAAYNLSAEHIFGGPSWFDSARFSVQAKPEEGAIPAGNVQGSNDHVRSMLQAMLANGFHLA